MKPAAFDYVRADSGAAAVRLLAQYGDDARLLAGGQSLVPMMNFRLARPAVLIDLADCADLAGITVSGGRLRIGAMVRQRDAELDAEVRRHCPLIGLALARAGSPTIRNRGTVGGSIANGYPTAQLLAVAACLEAEMTIEGPTGRRVVSARDFFLGPLTTVLAADELLREIAFPLAGETARNGFREAGNHAGGAALAVVCGHAEALEGGRLVRPRLAVLGVGDLPLRLAEVERALTGGAADLDAAWAADLAGVPASEGFDHRRALARALVDDVIADLQ